MAIRGDFGMPKARWRVGAMLLATTVLVAGCSFATGEEEHAGNGSASTVELAPQPLSLELEPGPELLTWRCCNPL